MAFLGDQGLIKGLVKRGEVGTFISGSSLHEDFHILLIVIITGNILIRSAAPTPAPQLHSPP